MKINYSSIAPYQNFWANSKRLEYGSKRLQENKHKERQKTNAICAAAAVTGAVLPVVAINCVKGRGKNFIQSFSKSGLREKAKSTFNILKIENCSDIISSAGGAIGLSTLCGTKMEKNPKNKEAKCKEGVFEFLNVSIPTVLVGIGEGVSKKTGKFSSAPCRALIAAGSVAGGMFAANKASNKINEKCFEDKSKRKFKPQDCLAHIDDILGLLVLAKVPVVDKIHVDKLLLPLYSKIGYEAGSAEADS